MRTLIAVFFAAFFLAAGAFAVPVNKTAVLDVPGMTCPICPITVRKALERVPGVEKISVNYPERHVRVTYDAARTNVAALLKATADAGYPATPERQGRP